MAYQEQVVKSKNVLYKHTCMCTLTGRHCCLYCEITHQVLQKPLADRGLSQPRTLDSLQRDHLQFCTKGGGNLKNAKFNNNVIGKALFHIPLTQVSVM